MMNIGCWCFAGSVRAIDSCETVLYQQVCLKEFVMEDCCFPVVKGLSFLEKIHQAGEKLASTSFIQRMMQIRALGTRTA
jgi:hypothetical protein